MFKEFKMKSKKIICALSAFFLIMIAIAPATAFAKEDGVNTYTIKVNQTVATVSNPDKITFTYKLTPHGEGYPMPVRSASDSASPGSYTFTITGNNSVELGPIAYPRTGLYFYELAQVPGEEKPGYVYDKRVYTVEVYVDWKLDIQTIIRHDGDKKSPESALFETSYLVKPTDRKLMVDPPVKKIVQGNPKSSATFTFKLTASDPSWPMPDGSKDGSKTLSIVGSGEGEFGTWSYDKEGTYVYKVTEVVNKNDKDYEYDKVVYTITDTVTDDNSQLVLTRTVTNKAGNNVNSLAFVNKYIDPKGGVAKTWDDMNITLYIVLIALSGTFIVGIAVERRKQKKA